MHNTVINPSGFAPPTKRVLKAYYLPGQGYRDACLQSETAGEACIWFPLNQLNLFSQANLQKGKAGAEQIGSWQLLKLLAPSFRSCIVSPIRVPSNYWHSTNSSVSHPTSAFCSLWSYCFSRLTLGNLENLWLPLTLWALFSQPTYTRYSYAGATLQA